MSVNIIAASFRSIWDDDILEITSRVVLNQIDVESLKFTPSPLFYKEVGVLPILTQRNQFG